MSRLSFKRPVLGQVRAAGSTRHGAPRLAAPLDPIGIILALVGVAMFSSKSILIKLAYRHGVDAATLLTLRMGFALPFYLVIGALAMRPHNRIAPQQAGRSQKPQPLNLQPDAIFKTALIGAVGYYLASLLDLSGLQYITAQLERLILFTYPVFVIILGALFFRQKLTIRAVQALLLAYAGVAVIFIHDLESFGPDVVKGVLLVFGSSLAFALYLLFSKAQISRLGSRVFTTIAMLSASLAILIHFAVSHSLADLVQPLPVYGYALAMAVFATVIPSYLINEAVARIGPGPKSIIGAVGPVATSLAAVAILGELFTVYHLIGMVLVLIGILRLSSPPEQSNRSRAGNGNRKGNGKN